MRHALAQTRAIGGETSLASETPTATVAMTALFCKPRRMGHSGPIRLGSSTCTATAGNGWKTFGTTATMAHQSMVRHGSRAAMPNYRVIRGGSWHNETE